MRIVIVVFFALLFLTAVVSLAIFYFQFTNWPPRVWRRRLESTLAEYRNMIARADDDPSARREAALRDERFQQYVHTIPLDRLADYPGIGPKTVEGLKDGGFERLDQLWQLNWWRSVPGIGEARAKALTTAAKTIRSDAETKFDAGTCPEGRDWLVERDRLRAGARAAAIERERTKEAAQKAIREAQSLVDLAHTVTFGSFLFHRHECPVTDDVMARPFPQVVVALAQAKPLPPPAAMPKNPTQVVPPPAIATPKSPINDGQLDRMRAYCRFAFVVARADGRVAVGEKKEIRSFLAELFGQDARLLRHLDPVIEQCENPPPQEGDAVDAVKAITTPAQRNDLMIMARRIADAVGDRSQKEQVVLDRIADALGVGHVAAAETTGETGMDEANARSVLEIDKSVELTPELIRRRFNILTDQYDPKRAAGLGTEFSKMAEAKRNAVKAATELLLKKLNAPLVAAAPVPAATPGDIRHNPDLDAAFGM